MKTAIKPSTIKAFCIHTSMSVYSISHSTHQFHSNAVSYRITLFNAYTVAYPKLVAQIGVFSIFFQLASATPLLNRLCDAAPNCSLV